jgi:hypothetical protein
MIDYEFTIGFVAGGSGFFHRAPRGVRGVDEG